MVKKKVWGMLLVCLLLVIPLVGCSGTADAASLDPDALLQEVLMKLNDVKSGSMQVSGSLDITVPNEEGKPERTSGDINMTVQAFKNNEMKVDFSITADSKGEALTCDMVMYFVEEDGQMKVYYKVDATPPSLGKTIVEGLEFKNGEALGPEWTEQQDPSAGLAEEYLTNPRIAGTENIGGRDVLCLRTELDLMKIINRTQESMLEQMSSDDQAAARMMLMSFGSIDMDIWVDAKTHDPVKIEVDLADQIKVFTELLGAMSESEDAGVVFNSLTLKLTVSDFNAVPDILVPVGLKTTENTKVSA